MNAILCGRGCQVVNIPEVTDLFGRTVEQLRAAIAAAEKSLEGARYGGPADNQRTERLRADLEVDRRMYWLITHGLDPKSPLDDRAIRTCLKQKWPDFEYQDSLSGDRLRQFRREITRHR